MILNNLKPTVRIVMTLAHHRRDKNTIRIMVHKMNRKKDLSNLS